MKKNMFLIPLFIFLISPVYAQQGYSSAALSMSQERAARKAIPSPSEIVVEEYLNYHTHKIPLPSGEENVKMDIRWNNTLQLPSQNVHLIDKGGEALLQIGFTTRRNLDASDLPPVNVSLVIDKSGSMEGDRMEKTKEAMLTFVERLRPKDKVSIVTFDHIAKVELMAQNAGNRQKINRVIEKIQTGGSTNLEGGLLLGYKELVKNYEANRSNRIILLTDAITNTGVIDPQQIIQNSSVYQDDYQIDFALIGVGVDFNYELSRQLKESKRGQVHFVNSAEDMQKVFIDEVESLLMPIAKKARLTVEYSDELDLVEVYGYQTELETSGKSFSIDLDDMNAGLTQVVLVKFARKSTGGQHFPVRVNLQYYDVQYKKSIDVLESTNLVSFKGQLNLRAAKNLFFTDSEVQKNHTIAVMAQCLKEMAKLCQQDQKPQASQLIATTIQKVKSDYPYLADADIQRMLDILQAYDTKIQAISFSHE